MSKYEERVKKLTEEFMRVRYPDHWADLSNREYKKGLEALLPLARLSVAREADAAKMALIDNNHDRPSVYMNDYLIRNGLITPQTQTTCNGECNSGIPSHTCPYKADVNDDNTLCSCCGKCTSACSDNR